MAKHCKKCDTEIGYQVKSGLCKKCFSEQSFICSECGIEFKSSGRNKRSLCQKCSQTLHGRNWSQNNKEIVNERAKQRYNKIKDDQDVKKRLKEHREKYKEKINYKQYQKEYYQANKERLLKKPEGYYKEQYDKNKELLREQARVRYHADLEKSRAYLKKRHHRERAKDLVKWKIEHNLRGRLQEVALAMKAQKISTRKALSCSYSQFKEYIESQWTENMTWDNYGKKDGWVFDHVIPLAFFDLTNLEEQSVATYYKNLQPLDWTANSSKKDTIDSQSDQLLKEILNDLNLELPYLIEKLEKTS